MTVRIEGNVIHLEGQCRVEEAEDLLVALQEGNDIVVDVRQLSRLHLSLAQILIAVRPTLCGAPTDPFLRDWLLPLMRTPE